MIIFQYKPVFIWLLLDVLHLACGHAKPPLSYCKHHRSLLTSLVFPIERMKSKKGSRPAFRAGESS